MCAQVIALTNENHRSMLISAFNELRESNIGVNCTVVAEGHQMKVHQVLLSSFSPFFELLFKEGIEEHPTIILTGTSYKDLTALIHYMYHGKLEVPLDQINSLLETAKYLLIKGLGDTNNDGSEKNVILPLQTDHARKHKGNKDDAVIPAQNDILESQSYRGSIQHQTPTVSPVHHVELSPAHSISSDATLIIESSEPRYSFPVTSLSYSSEPSSLSLNDESVVNIESEDETFSTKSVQPQEPERQNNEELNLCDSSRKSPIQGIREETNICLSANVRVTNDNNSDPYVLKDCTSTTVFNLPSAELPSPMACCPSVTKPISCTSGELSEAATGTSFLFVDPAELEVDESIHSNLDVNTEDTCREEIAMLDGVSVSNEQDKILVEEKHVVTTKSECSGEESQRAASTNGLPDSCLPQTPRSSEITSRSSRSRTAKSNTKTTRKRSGKATPSLLKNTVCRECQQSFPSLLLLRKHMGAHRGLKLYKCTECDYAASVYYQLRKHQLTHGDPRPYKCAECDYAAAEKSNLRQHCRIHTGERPYKCTECSYAAYQNRELVKHQRIHTGERPYKCSECSYAATQKSGLRMHLRIHTGVKPYKCTVCDYAAVNKSNLIAHVRTHTGEKPFKCNECDYAATRGVDVRIHQRIHSGIKPYKCDDCVYSAAQSSVLLIHRKRYHSGIKLETPSADIAKHRLIHAAIRPLKCDVCGYTTTKKYNLRKHILTHRNKKL